MKQKRRIYYVPGILSLICLPIVCLVYFHQHPLKTEDRVIEINMPRKYNPLHNGRNSIVFDTTVLSRPENLRQYKEIEVKGDPQMRAGQIEAFKENVHQLIETNDTKHGVHALLSKDVTYGDFIELINICNFADTLTHYIVFEDHIWFLHKNVSHEAKVRTQKWKEERIAAQQIKEKELKVARIIELGNETITDQLKRLLSLWPLLIAFTILGILSMRSMLKK